MSLLRIKFDQIDLCGVEFFSDLTTCHHFIIIHFYSLNSLQSLDDSFNFPYHLHLNEYFLFYKNFLSKMSLITSQQMFYRITIRNISKSSKYFRPCNQSITCFIFLFELFQMLDMVKPALNDRITLRDLKQCKLAKIFFDTFFNIGKYLEHEQKDPFAPPKVSLLLFLNIQT